MTNDKDAFIELIKQQNREHGASDCEHGIEPQREDPDYLSGYANKYAEQQQLSRGFN
jgi:hypothetical protein